MKKAMRTVFVFAAVLLVATFFFGGCTKYAKQEQLKALEEAKSAALAAEKSLADCKNQTAALEGQLAQKQQKLQEMKAEKQTVDNRLAAMGN